MAPIQSVLAAGLLALPAVLGHPGHDVGEEALERAQFMKKNPNTVRSCSYELARSGHLDAAIARRQEMSIQSRAKRGLAATRAPLAGRDLSDYNHTHESTLDVTLGSDETTLFYDNSTCLLAPEATNGPYYVDGELIRHDVTEGQAGVPLFLEVQLIDTSSCEPMPAVFIDIWQCNSTGVYSGVLGADNGNPDDTSVLDATFLRGIAQTDFNGVAQFETIFPGHYIGRTNHIHILSHPSNDTVVRTNGTLLGSNATTHASHVGQLYFDQDLISQVEATAPYNTNTQEHLPNAEDSILGDEAKVIDPFVQWVQLGDDISDGIMAWITVAIDPTIDYEVGAAASNLETGNVETDGFHYSPGNEDDSSSNAPSRGADA